MKKIFFSIITVGCLISMISCGGNSQTKEDNEESSNSELTTQEVSLPEMTQESQSQTPAVTPPVTIKAVRYGTWMGGESREFLTLTLKSNGMIEGTLSDQEWKRNGEDNWFIAGGDPDNIPAIYKGTTYTGKWTSRHREVGEDFQKVYDTPAGYIPDDGEYVFKSWERCSEFTPDNMDFKIIEIVKD